MSNNIKKNSIISIFLILHSLAGVSASLDFFVKNEDGKMIKNVSFICFQTGEEYYEPSGHLRIDNLKNGIYQFTVFADLYESTNLTITINDQPINQDIILIQKINLQDTITIKHVPKSHWDDVHNDIIIDSKKHEIIDVENLDGSKATNNPRQLFATVPLTNTVETDGAGIQLGIGGRGLDPHRSSNFNIRQNGYDISADALGYPESYYSPPAEAVKEIEVLRGAASLQYGTQFGLSLIHI